MSLLPRLTLAAMLAVASLAAAPTPAGANGPASHVLLSQDVFFPFQPRVSKELADALQATVARAKQAGYPLKVALVASDADLGPIPNMFNKPDAYAPFLARELPSAAVPTLIAMPAGVAAANATQPATNAIASIKVDKDEKSDGLARAVIEAIPKMATASGHPIPATKVPPAADSGGGPSPLLVFGAPVVLVALAALVIGLRRRRDEEDEEAPSRLEDEDEGEARGDSEDPAVTGDERGS